MEPKKDFIEFDLTKQEIEDRKTILCAELDNFDRITLEASTVASDFKAQIKKSEEKLQKLRNAIKEGKELFQVEITFHQPKDGKKTIKRLDTGKKIIADMTEVELEEHAQRELNI